MATLMTQGGPGDGPPAKQKGGPPADRPDRPYGKEAAPRAPQNLTVSPAEATRIRQQVLQRHAALKSERESWVDHWRQVSDVVLPRRGRFLISDRNKGSRRNRKVIDNTATLALRDLASGLMGGVTSPARPWFRLSTQRPGLIEDGDARRWLADVERLMREIFNRSNTYNALFSVYEELAAFGTAAMLVYEDYDTVISCETLTAGQYCVAPDKHGRVHALYRDHAMTVEQVVQEFVETAPGQYDWSVVSSAVRQQWERGLRDGWVDVMQAIEPNPDYRPESKLARHARFRSLWLEVGGPPDRLLRLSGFQEFPALCPRWNIAGADIYGTSPAMDALGDVEQLQMQEREKAKAIQKMVNPPLNVPTSTQRNAVVNALPNGITYFDPTSGGTSAAMATPLYQVQPRVMELQQDMEVVRQRIRASFHADLWRMITDLDRSGITATEVDARKEEKLVMLGPVLERLHHELLDPLIDRTFAIAQRAGILPEIPETLGGQDIRVEYISMLAQAQRAVAINGIERMVGFVGQLAQMDPSVLDKLDRDQAVDEVAEAIGAPPRLIRSDDEVGQMRQQREQAQAQQAQAQQQMAMMQQAAQGAQTLSQTDTSGQNALTDLMALTGGAM